MMATDSGDYMLTTIDNPWNPFTHYDEWYAWDRDHGYDSPGLLARIANVSFELSDSDNDQSILDAIDEIVNQNVSGMAAKAMRPAA
jgi:hypothetical protein